MFAMERLRKAFLAAGYESVDFEMEPVAAAYFYQSTLDHEELILIGDFGGGTSDFSLLRVGPKVRTAEDFLGNSGLGLAGDAFDAKIVRNLVSPRLGAGSMARAHEKVLPAVPNWVYAKLERWHHLSFLRTRAVLNMLAQHEGTGVRAGADRGADPLDRRGSGVSSARRGAAYEVPAIRGGGSGIPLRGRRPGDPRGGAARGFRRVDRAKTW